MFQTNIQVAKEKKADILSLILYNWSVQTLLICLDAFAVFGNSI